MRLGADDAVHLARAIALAGADESRTSPNPTVGCVIVDGSGTVVGHGSTQPPGGRHAEVVALDEAGAAATGATAYVTLEPCDHVGRTGPCSIALREAGISRVVVAVRDPVVGHGGGLETLRAGGVDVELVDDDGWSQAVTLRFLERARTGRPWITLKLAHRVDGSTVVDDGQWITGDRARRRVHLQRSRHDAVLVGVGTVLADDPRLDVRDVAHVGTQPRPVVLDSRARTPVTARTVARGALVVVAEGADRDRCDRLRRAGATVEVVAGDDVGRVRLDGALAACATHDLHDLYAEPGDTLATALVRQGLVAELILHRPAGPVAARPPAWRRGDWTLVAASVLGEDVEERWRGQPTAT